jgi:molecular chaperone GrpE
MSDAAPSLQSPGPDRESERGPLTPERIERVLADFRRWLTELPAADGAPLPAETVDLHTLVAQFTALRHEVNLQTRAARTALEQNAAALGQLESVVGQVREHPAGCEDLAGPLLKTIIDVYDALALAARQVEKQKEKIGADLGGVLNVEARSGTSNGGFWGRLFGGRPSAAVEARELRLREASEQLTQLVDGLVTGYAMSLARIERVLPQFGVEAIPCAGQRFDPEMMEVVEIVADGNRPSGEVVDEVRRGYIRDGVVFRFAQVRVAR